MFAVLSHKHHLHAYSKHWIHVANCISWTALYIGGHLKNMKSSLKVFTVLNRRLTNSSGAHTHGEWGQGRSGRIKPFLRPPGPKPRFLFRNMLQYYRESLYETFTDMRKQYGS